MLRGLRLPSDHNKNISADDKMRQGQDPMAHSTYIYLDIHLE